MTNRYLQIAGVYSIVTRVLQTSSFLYKVTDWMMLSLCVNLFHFLQTTTLVSECNAPMCRTLEHIPVGLGSQMHL